MFLLVCVQEIIFWLCDPSVRSGVARTRRLFVGEAMCVSIYICIVCIHSVVRLSGS